MQNPFSKEQIKNYLLLYGGVVVIMILFYLLNTLLNEPKQHEKRVFESSATTVFEVKSDQPSEGGEDENRSDSNRFKLLEKAY